MNIERRAPHRPAPIPPDPRDGSPTWLSELALEDVAAARA